MRIVLESAEVENLLKDHLKDTLGFYPESISVEDIQIELNSVKADAPKPKKAAKSKPKKETKKSEPMDLPEQTSEKEEESHTKQESAQEDVGESATELKTESPKGGLFGNL